MPLFEILDDLPVSQFGPGGVQVQARDLCAREKQGELFFYFLRPESNKFQSIIAASRALLRRGYLVTAVMTAQLVAALVVCKRNIAMNALRGPAAGLATQHRSEEHTSELQSP